MINTEIMMRAIIRFSIIAGLIITLAFLIYRIAVFTPTMWAFQYFISGITIGLAYVTFRDKNYRIGLVLLLLWYIILVSVISEGNSWVFILDGAYTCIIALAVHLYIIIINKPFIKNEISRIIASTIILGVCNSLIILVLNLYSFQSLFAHFSYMLDAMFLNLRIGAMLGLFMGVGIELSNYFIDVVYKGKRITG